MDRRDLQRSKVAIRHGVVLRGSFEAEILPRLPHLYIVLVNRKDNIPRWLWHGIGAIVNGYHGRMEPDVLDAGRLFRLHGWALDLDIEDAVAGRFQRGEALGDPLRDVRTSRAPILPRIGIVGDVELANRVQSDNSRGYAGGGRRFLVLAFESLWARCVHDLKGVKDLTGAYLSIASAQFPEDKWSGVAFDLTC